MRVPEIIPGLVLMCALVACRKEAPAPSEPTPSPAEPVESEPDEEPVAKVPMPDPEERPDPLTVKLVTADRTRPEERPVDLSEDVQAIAEEAAKEAGFTIDPDGHLLGVSFFYGIIADGKTDADAERGTIAWGIEGTLRIIDEDGLGEVIEGRRGDERPFVRGAIPDLKAAYESVLKDAAVGALRDVAMKVRYRDADEAKCVEALRAAHPEERWAAMRRLGELKAKDRAPDIIELLDGADDLTLAVATGVLGRLGNPAAIKPLARIGEDPNPGRALLAVSALDAIGGKEARKYLKLIAASHPDLEVRKAVEALLAAGSDRE